jgi:hypothetical protein
MSNVVPFTPDDELAVMLGPEPMPPPMPRRPFQNWTDEDIATQPKLRFLIGDARRPILGEGALWQIYGKKKSAKTLFTMEAAFCIAFGLPFHGLPTLQGQVVYVIAEGGIERNYQRMKALWLKYETEMRAKGYTSLADAREKTGNLILIDQTIALASDNPKDPYSAKAFLGEMELAGVKNPVLVVLDTWARSLWASGGHDSSQEIVGPSVQACEMIRKKLGGCTLAMLAHVGAAGTQAKGLTDPANAIDGGLSCVKEGEGFANSVFTFTTVDQRHAEEGFALRAKLMIPEGAESVTLDSDDAAVASIAIAKAPPSARAWLSALRSLERETVTTDEWLAEARRLGTVKGKNGGTPSDDSFRTGLARATEQLVKIGAISLSADKTRVTLTLERVEQVQAESDFGFGSEEDESGE